MASSDEKWPKVMSSHHRNRHCGPCFLCQKEQPRYDHFCKLSGGEQRFLEQHDGSDIRNDSCLCRAHSKEAKKQRSDPEFIPVWKRSILKTTDSITSCMYPECNSTN